MPVSLFSPAKINLGLRIVGRRTDGFHLLESLFWPLNFGDTLTLTEGKTALTMQWAKEAPQPNTVLPPFSENIIWRVLSDLGKLQTLNLSIEVKKQIPLGGGLGGGSSNIGTLVAHLIKQKKWETPTPDLSRYGADIPFFLNAIPSWVSGIGEKVQPLKVSPELLQNKKIYFLLVLFPFGCDTATIFKKYRERGSSFSSSCQPEIKEEWDQTNLFNYLSQLRNDLEPVVTENYPMIAETLEKLRASPCLAASLSGSGATCYGIFDNIDSREKTIKDLSTFFRRISCKSITAETFTSQ